MSSIMKSTSIAQALQCGSFLLHCGFLGPVLDYCDESFLISSAVRAEAMMCWIYWPAVFETSTQTGPLAATYQTIEA